MHLFVFALGCGDVPFMVYALPLSMIVTRFLERRRNSNGNDIVELVLLVLFAFGHVDILFTVTLMLPLPVTFTRFSSKKFGCQWYRRIDASYGFY